MQTATTAAASSGREILSSPWQKALSGAISDPRELLERLALPLDLLPAAKSAADRFGLRVPQAYLDRIRPGDPDDPLLRQVLPLADELSSDPEGYRADAVGDLKKARSPGLLHKYHGRALLIVTGACAIHCRYCFRREYPYGSAHAGGRSLDAALAQIEQDDSLNEIILSGGDPLSLSNSRLESVVSALENISHIKTLRIHSRLPTVVPERVDDGLTNLLGNTGLRTVFVTHVNHAAEIDGNMENSMAALSSACTVLLNQSVLLKGVNDNADTLVQLSEMLFRHEVLPYYLHLPDKVSGTAHFDVDESRGRRLLADMAARLPGYLVPRLAREEPGLPSKTLLGH